LADQPFKQPTFWVFSSQLLTYAARANGLVRKANHGFGGGGSIASASSATLLLQLAYKSVKVAATVVQAIRLE